VKEEMRGREEKGQAKKADWMERMNMVEEKMEQREKKESKNNVVITGNKWKYRERCGRMVRKGDRGESECKMLAKIESWEQKKNIMLNKSKLKERKGERMYRMLLKYVC
jgi:hypothetical protein